MNREKIIRRIVRRCGTTDPFRICKAYHIIVQYKPLGKAYGLHQYAYHQHIIYINENLDEYWQRFTCAHELGHVFLHEKENTKWLQAYTGFSIEKIEHQADDFAIALLTHDAEIEEGMTDAGLAALVGIPAKFVERVKSVIASRQKKRHFLR